MKFLKIIFWPIIFMVGTFFIRFIFVMIYNNKYYHNTNLYNVINNLDYQKELTEYINNYTLLIVIISFIIFFPIFYLVYSKNREDKKNNNKITIKKMIHYIVLGSIISLIYNLYLSIITNYSISKLSLITQIISSGLVGPIIEELLFRGIIYNKLKCFYNKEKSMIITTILFSLMHSSLNDILYTMFMGYLLVYIYEKTKTLKYSIILHISSNISVILLSCLMILNNIYLNIVLFIILLFIFIMNFIYKNKQFE